VCGAFSSVKLLINMKKLVLLPILLFSTQLFAADLQHIDLLDVSTSGKSLVLDRGALEHYEEGLYARFYLQRGTKEYPKVFLVAEGELIKSFPKKSFWYLRKVFIPDAIKRDSKLLVFTNKDVDSGRVLTIKERTSVSSQTYDDPDMFIAEEPEQIPARFAKEEADYEAGPDIFDQYENEIKGSTKNTNVMATNYQTYQNKKGPYNAEFGDLTNERYYVDKKLVQLGDIKKAEDKKLFETMSEHYLKQANNMAFGIKGFYKDQEKIAGLPDVSAKSSENSFYEELKERKKHEGDLNPHVLAKYKRDGNMWSADMDDSTLRKYFIQTGIDKEAKRRALALSELDGNEILVHASFGVNSHSNTSDPNNQGSANSFGIAYDLHLSRTSANLKNWSLQFVLDKETNHYDTGIFNAQSSELSYGFYVNYYFHNNPTTLNDFILLVGAGVKNGNATLSSGNFSQEYSYQVITAPALQFMTKYRFRSGDLTEDNINAGLSLNFGVSADMKNLSAVDTVSEDINSKFSVTDLKYTLGMSVYF
jgi:hypothetical protein